ncbi:MAG TPA: hypothetical protein VKZ63_10140 [Kofleriaceae bacterium]|nr:hypothetical protein [Kofleriaceae bacterium]
MSQREVERDRLDELIEEIEAEFPGFRIIRKPESRLQRAIHRFLCLASFGQMRDYLDGYHTTIGTRIYVTGDWERMSRDRRYLVLRHERIHMRQFRRFTPVGMALLYLLVPLPIGLAYFRARFEMEAYAESIRAAAEVFGPGHVRDPAYRARTIRQFTGPAYGFMWPFPRALERWYDRVLAELRPRPVDPAV